MRGGASVCFIVSSVCFSPCLRGSMICGLWMRPFCVWVNEKYACQKVGIGNHNYMVPTCLGKVLYCGLLKWEFHVLSLKSSCSKVSFYFVVIEV